MADIHDLPELDEVLSSRPPIPNLAHWFSEGAIRAIHGYLEELRNARLPERAADVARFALSRVAVRISRQQSDTQYRASRADISGSEDLESLSHSLAEVRNKLPLFLSRASPSHVEIRTGDARQTETFAGAPAPDLIITSPPYPNAYEYWLYHKYRMFWLDMDPLHAKSLEIGARPFYSGTGKLGPSDFRADLASVLRVIDQYAKSNATQLWVVGDGIIKGERFDTADELTTEASRLNWKCIRRYERRVARSRSSFQGIGRLKTESVVVLSRC